MHGTWLQVDNSVIEFFIPAAERLLSSDQPSRVLAAALASMAGFRHVPQPRSLLTYETGLVTLRLLTNKGECTPRRVWNRNVLGFEGHKKRVHGRGGGRKSP